LGRKRHPAGSRENEMTTQTVKGEKEKAESKKRKGEDHGRVGGRRGSGETSTNGK